MYAQNRNSIHNALSTRTSAMGINGGTGRQRHNYVHPVGDTLSIPPATPSPFADQYAGTKSLKFVKMIFHSTNKTSSSPSNADFTIDMEKSSISNLQVGMISLSDIIFPAGQYMIEEEWNHIDYNEGIVPTSFFRDIFVRYPDETDQDNYYLEQRGILPLTFNTIESIIVEDESTNMYRFRTSEPFGSDISYMQEYFNTNLFIGANRFKPSGQQSLSKTAGVRVSNVTSKHSSNTEDGRTIEDTIHHEFRVILPTSVSSALAELNPVIHSDCLSVSNGGLGYLIATPLADPAALATVATNLLNRSNTYRKHRFDESDVEATSSYIRYQFSFSWDPVDDRFYIHYQLATTGVSPDDIDENDMPVIDGPIIQYMGFRVPFQLPPFVNGSTSRKIAANTGPRTSPFNGTRVTPGDYSSGTEVALAIQNAMNGTWFGKDGSEPNLSNPLPFVITVTFVGVCYSVWYCAGRYTPYEIANIFNDTMVDVHAVRIRMEPLFDGYIWLGMKFYYDPLDGIAFPFDLPFSDTDLMRLDPTRIGYGRQTYRGKNAYYPTRSAPLYPTIIQYDTATFVPSVQHYRVQYEKSLKRLSFTAEPFAPELACVTSVTDTPDCHIIVITLPIAHGAVAGQHVYISLIPEGNPVIDSVTCPDMVACTDGAALLRSAILGELCSDPDSKVGPEDMVSCVVLPSESLDDQPGFYKTDGQGSRGLLAPNQLRLSFGGTQSSSIITGLGQDLVGRKVVLNFTASNMWSWNCSWNVTNCIHRQIVGVDPVYYVFVNTYPLTSSDAPKKSTTYVYGTDAFSNTGVPKNAVLLESTMSFPSVNQGLVLTDVSTFNCPHIVTLHPFKGVYLVVSLNSKDGDGNTIGIQTTKEPSSANSQPGPVRMYSGSRVDESADSPGLVNGSQINALAHILIGAKSPTGIVDLHDRLFEIQYTGVQKIASVRFQFINPDGTYYHFHGREVAVGLLLSTVQEHVITTQ